MRNWTLLTSWDTPEAYVYFAAAQYMGKVLIEFD
jgi:hypothetical protein